MKNGLLIVVLVMVNSLLVVSCDKSDDSSDKPANVDATEVKTALEDGEWQITYYFDDKDETSDYAGYVLTFNADGVVNASKGTASHNGTWSISDSDLDDNSSDGSVEFIIFFATPALFEELADDWDFLKFSNTKIELRDISGGDGSIDLLTIEKM